MEHLWDIVSRKFFCFCVGSYFFYVHILSENGWLIIAGAYMGLNLLEKFTSKKEQ